MTYPALALLLVQLLFNPLGQPAQDETGFAVHRISERVILLSDIAAGGSQLAIASERGIVVLDTLWSNITARKYRAAISDALGRDDFAYTINTVERLDMIGGNETYKDTAIIAHENFRHLLNKEEVDAELRQLIEMWRWKEKVSRDRLPTHEPGSEAEKGEISWMNTCKRRADDLEQGFSLYLPSLYYKDRMTLDLGDLTLKLFYFGRAGYDAITLVEVPEERLAIISGFIMHDHHLAPYPYSRYIKLDVPRWIAVYEEILGEGSGVEKVVCGSMGEVWTKERALTRLDYIKKLWKSVKILEAEGLTLEEVQERLSLDSGFSYIKELQTYKNHGDDWVRPQHRDHVRLFYLQHKKMASEVIKQELLDSPIEAAIARYNELIENPEGYYIDELSFNSLGYYLLNGGRIADAIELFKLNVRAFPESANVYDSLGEAYMQHGDTELAIANYRNRSC